MMLNVVLFDKPMRNSRCIYSYSGTKLNKSKKYPLRINPNNNEASEDSECPIIGQCTVIKNKTGLYVTKIETTININFTEYDPNYILLNENKLCNDGPENELKPACKGITNKDINNNEWVEGVLRFIYIAIKEDTIQWIRDQKINTLLKYV
jgi:hypothetical protein